MHAVLTLLTANSTASDALVVAGLCMVVKTFARKATSKDFPQDFGPAMTTLFPFPAPFEMHVFIIFANTRGLTPA